MERDAERIDGMARAICAEKCAFYGEPPCYRIGDWPNEHCDEPGCPSLAAAVAAHLARAQDRGGEDANQT